MATNIRTKTGNGTRSGESAPVIVVTGANRGIGLEICRQLAERGARVVLTARDPEAVRKAAERLGGKGITFHPLEVTNEDSVEKLRQFVETEFGHLDVLINNAGVFAKDDGPALEVKPQRVRATLETNTLGPLRLSQAFAALLKRSKAGRIINVSSGMGALSEMGGGYAAYRISKTALNAVSAILAAELSGSVAVNSMCPGWVKTDMGGPNAEREVAQGADTAVWLALDAPQKLTGKFVRDRKVIDW